MYHQNLHWQECEYVDKLDVFPKEIKHEIKKYLNKPIKYEQSLNKRDMDEIEDIINDYDCRIRFRNEDLEITRNYSKGGEFCIEFEFNAKRHQFIYRPKSELRYLYFRYLSTVYWDDLELVSQWLIYNDDYPLELRIGAKKVKLGLIDKIRNIFKK